MLSTSYFYISQMRGGRHVKALMRHPNMLATSVWQPPQHLDAPLIP